MRLGSSLAPSPDSDSEPSSFRSFPLGVATGLLWAPCAGPILGLILTGAALEGANTGTLFLLLAYATGAATSLAVALLAGAKVLLVLKRSLGAEIWIRRVLGFAVPAGVAAIAFGLDRGVLTKLSLASTSGVEQSLIDRIHPDEKPKQPAMMMMSSKAPGTESGPETIPELSGAVAWINSQPLNRDQLKGKVVLVDFWTYSCINCVRTLPYIRAWAEKYKDAGPVVIGVHTPEFPFEKDADNVRLAVHELNIAYPVALDNDYKIWKAFSNKYWPADYLIDGTGRIRYHHFGEGKYDETEQQIQALLKERNSQLSATGLVKVTGAGAEAPARQRCRFARDPHRIRTHRQFRFSRWPTTGYCASLLCPNAPATQSMGTLRFLDRTCPSGKPRFCSRPNRLSLPRAGCALSVGAGIQWKTHRVPRSNRRP